MNTSNAIPALKVLIIPGCMAIQRCTSLTLGRSIEADCAATEQRLQLRPGLFCGFPARTSCFFKVVDTAPIAA